MPASDIGKFQLTLIVRNSLRLTILTWENLCFTEFSTKILHKNSVQKWLLLSVTFTKLELVFVLTFENTFS